MQRDDIGLGQKFLEVNQRDAHLLSNLLGNVRIERDDLHVKGSGPFCHVAGDAAKAD